MTMVLSMSVGSYASTDSKTTVLTDEKGIEDYIEENDIKVPEGYTLEKVILEPYAVEAENTNLFKTESANPKAVGDYAKNSKLVKSDIYFSDSPISSDWYDGPTESQEYTFEEKVEAKVKSTFGCSVDAIEAAVDFELTGSVSKSKKVTLKGVEANKKLNVKIFGVYDKYSFDVYSIFNNYQGTGYAYKPMGLYIAQEIYGK